MSARKTSSALRNEFGKRIATSNGGLRRNNRVAATTDFDGKAMTSSTSGTIFQSAASFSGAAILTCASGRPLLIALIAGTLMTASPSQLLLRIKIRNGFSSIPSGRKTPRLYLASRKFGRGVFQRLCTQNQSSGARRTCFSKISFPCAVNFSIDSLEPSIGGSATARQRAKPSVWTANPINFACVRRASSAGNGVVEASLPKNGVHSPPSPAC